ncbi:MAG TPA: hypothetical protein PLZ32_10255 [Saprospiraceae bacterium]|nr:hypothetical protein [Saprospiraceae bacterium]
MKTLKQLGNSISQEFRKSKTLTPLENRIVNLHDKLELDNYTPDDIRFMLLQEHGITFLIPIKTGAGFNEATQKAFDYIKDNYIPGQQVVIYGYSWGGTLVNHLADRLIGENIKVNLLITIDAAGGPENEFVRRTVSNNVEENLNIFQTEPPVISGINIGSHGQENKSCSPSTCVINSNYTGYYKGIPGNEDFNPVTHGNIDEVARGRVVKAIEKVIDP